MRKLLINSTALATVAGLTASIAVADVAITATTEYAITKVDSKVTASNGGFHTSTSEVGFTFSQKTDTGLSLTYNTQLTSAGTVAIDESNLTIAGGFGKVVLGQKDGVGGTYGMGATDLIAEESGYGETLSSTISTGSDIVLGTNDNNKVAYHMPVMGGLTAGVSFEDSGTVAAASGATDITSYGARYVTEVSGMAVTLAAAYAEQDAVQGNTKGSAVNAGIKVVRGQFSAIAASTNYLADDEDRTSTGFALSYKMDDTLTVGMYEDDSTDKLDLNEKYKISGIEAQYVIAPGLTAVLSRDVYDYDSGTADAANAGQISDDGTLTKLTIKAAF